MSDKSIVFFSNEMTNRLSYTAKLVFEDLLGLNIVFTQDSNGFLKTKFPKINYSQTPLSIGHEFYIKNQTLLFENQIIRKEYDADFEVFSKATFLNFDFLTAIFLLVTRYEEYIVAPPPSNRDNTVFDHHNRFPAKASWAYKFGFLQKPIVNQWVMQLNSELKQLFPELKTTLPQYRFQPTFDIDMPWKYKNKGFVRTMGGFAKDIVKGNFSELKNRLNILRGDKNDPDYTFDYIFDLHKTHNCPPIFFLLLGDHAEFDKNPDENNTDFKNLILYISAHYTVGLHPSYRSNSSFAILEKEKKRFERMTRLPLEISRQHFLKLRFPETYHRLLDLGVKQDYSMGYADDIGFRASITTPFRWFDLANNVETDLWIYPFQVMDVTLKDYLNLSPIEAFEQVKMLIEETKAVGGTFITLWHNSSFSNTEGWENWREMYEKLLLVQV